MTTESARNQWDVVRLAGSLGAEVRGADLRNPMKWILLPSNAC